MLNRDAVVKQVIDWLIPIGEQQLKGLASGVLNTNVKAHAIDYVTDYDILSEQQLVAQIETTYPDHSIMAEEGHGKDRGGAYTWVIDPIDGTTNYAHGFPFFCISVGLKYNSQTILGVVHAPMLGYTFSAIRGQGAYLNGERLQVTMRSQLKDCLVGTGFPYSRAEDNMNIPFFLKVVNHVSGIRRCGSAALDLCMVAAGMLDAYWEFYLNEWDICAGRLIVEEAGGRTELIAVGDHTMTLASNGHLHDTLKRQLFD